VFGKAPLASAVRRWPQQDAPALWRAGSPLRDGRRRAAQEAGRELLTPWWDMNGLSELGGQLAEVGTDLTEEKGQKTQTLQLVLRFYKLRLLMHFHFFLPLSWAAVRGAGETGGDPVLLLLSESLPCVRERLARLRSWLGGAAGPAQRELPGREPLTPARALGPGPGMAGSSSQLWRRQPGLASACQGLAGPGAAAAPGVPLQCRRRSSSRASPRGAG